MESDNGRYHRCCLQIYKKSLGDFRIKNLGDCTEWYTTFGWCIGRFLKQMHRNMQAWSCILFAAIRISMVGMSEKDRSGTGITDRHRHATNDKE